MGELAQQSPRNGVAVAWRVEGDDADGAGVGGGEIGDFEKGGTGSSSGVGPREVGGGARQMRQGD